MKNKKAFTLIEVMVVVIIIGILSALAMPSFNKSMNKAREKEARTILELIYNAEKVYRLDKKKYVSAIDASASAWADLSGYIDNPNDSADYYNYKVTPVDNIAVPQTFTATATQKSDATKIITINQSGVQNPAE